MTKQYTCCLIGVGKQNIKDHLPALQRSGRVTIAGGYDTSSEALEKLDDVGVRSFDNLEHMLDTQKPDFVSIAVPHHAYYNIITLCAKRGIHILKEKPFAMSTKESESITQIINTYKTKIQICAQKRYTYTYETLLKLLPHIGDVYSIFIQNTLSLDGIHSRRSDIHQSGGGTVLDLGYHYLDLLVHLFGLPKTIYANLQYTNGLDTHMKGQFTYDSLHGNKGNKVLGNIVLSLTYYTKSDKFQIYGSKGFIKLEGNTIGLYDPKNNLLEEHTYVNNNIDCVDRQIASFIDLLDHDKKNDIQTHFNTMKLIDAIYESDKQNRAIIIH